MPFPSRRALPFALVAAFGLLVLSGPPLARAAFAPVPPLVVPPGLFLAAWVPPPPDDDDPPLPAGDWMDGEIVCGLDEYHVRYHKPTKKVWVWVYSNSVLVAVNTWIVPPNQQPTTQPQFLNFLYLVAVQYEGAGAENCSIGITSFTSSLFDGSYSGMESYFSPGQEVTARVTFGRGTTYLEVRIEPPAEGATLPSARLVYVAPTGGFDRELDPTCDAACVDAMISTVDARIVDATRRRHLQFVEALEMLPEAAAGAVP